MRKVERGLLMQPSRRLSPVLHEVIAEDEAGIGAGATALGQYGGSVREQDGGRR